MSLTETAYSIQPLNPERPAQSLERIEAIHASSDVTVSGWKNDYGDSVDEVFEIAGSLWHRRCARPQG